jgi:hypothetical protein
MAFLLVLIGGSHLRLRVPNAVRDEVTKPSAAGGGCSEAEEAQNKEYHKRTAK